MISEKQNNEHAVILEVVNRLYSSRDRAELRAEIQDRIDRQNRKHVILDFSQPRWFGAPILDELILAAQTLAEKNLDLLLVGSPKIERMLNAARADRVKRFASVHTALASFGRPDCAAA